MTVVILKFVKKTAAALERDTTNVRDLSSQFLAGEHVDRKDVRATVAAIRRNSQALAWVYDGLLGELLKACPADVSKSPPAA